MNQFTAAWPAGADHLRTAWDRLAAGAEAMPDIFLAIAVLVLAVALALLAYTALLRIVARLVRSGRPLLAAIFTQTQAPLRLAFVVLALRIAAPLVPLGGLSVPLGRALQVAFIMLLGWIAHVAVNLAASVYLRRFQTDVDDNLLARKHVTQTRILKRAVGILIVIVTLSAALMTFEAVRQYGVSLFASAGIAGLVVGFAARPLLSNLIAGVQMAITQPIRLDDVVIVEGQWGRIEEITSTYVVVNIWDLRRLVVPLTYFIEKPFENWTRRSAQIIGSVFLYVDYTVPLARLRAKAEEIARTSPHWDGQVVSVQVTDCKESTVELRVLASAAHSSAAWDLRCEIREKLIDFLQREYPDALPRIRARIDPQPREAAAASGSRPI